MHITIHTSQTWADTFISELNDTHVEAELRVRHIPPAVRMLRRPRPDLDAALTPLDGAQTDSSLARQ